MKLAPQIAAPPRSIVDAVCEGLMGAILDGTFGPGARLPAERELAGQVGASRVTVREAIRRLVDWRVVTTRQGSGATVLPRRYWTANALSAAIQRSLDRADWEALLPVVRDAFALRRFIVLDVIERAAIPLRGQTLGAARAALDAAWAAHEDSVAFAQLDREIIPIILETAGMYPSLWTLNSLADAYLHAMSLLATGLRVPKSYVGDHLSVLDALEAGDGPIARARMGRYLDALDQAIIVSLPPGLLEQLMDSGK